MIIGTHTAPHHTKKLQKSKNGERSPVLYFLVWCEAVWGDRFIITPFEFLQGKWVTLFCSGNMLTLSCVNACMWLLSKWLLIFYKYVYTVYFYVRIYRSAGLKHDLLLRGARSHRVKDKARAEEVAKCYTITFTLFPFMYRLLHGTIDCFFVRNESALIAYKRWR